MATVLILTNTTLTLPNLSCNSSPIYPSSLIPLKGGQTDVKGDMQRFLAN